MADPFLFIDGETVRRYLTPEDVIATVKGLWANWRNGAVLEGEHAFLPAGGSGENVFLHIPASLPGLGVLGFKWINCYMKPAPGYPFSHGNIIVLNDIETGSIRALVSATDITAMRTAGGHGVVAARCLAGREVRTLAVIGSGSQAERGIAGFLCEFPELEHVRVYCRREEAFRRLEEKLEGRAACRRPEEGCAGKAAGRTACQWPEKSRVSQAVLEYVGDCRQVCRGADVVLVATSSPDILLRYEYLDKGTTVIALDGFNDVEPEISWKADKWFVGNRKTDVLEIIGGEMSHGVKLDEGNICGEVADVMAGRIPGREKEDEIIVYTHMGSGAYDVACAYKVYQKAVEAKVGVELWL